MGPWAWFLAAAAVAVVGTYGRDTPEVIRSLSGGGCRGAANRPLVESLAAKWGPIFGCPTATLVAISKIESGWRPLCVAMYGGAISRGGAWGLCQQTLATAKGHVAVLNSHSDANVRVTVGKFNGTGTSLLDADLNICLAAYHLGKLTSEFGSDFGAVALAYHSGAAVARKMKTAGKAVTPATIVATRPNARTYVARALAARESVA